MTGFGALLTGHILVKRYRIGPVIGRGGFAVVYEAHDERLDRAVAVKVITSAGPEGALEEEMRHRFQREARASAGLQHRNVVGVFDFGTDPTLGLDFLVMERLRGEDLRTRLRRDASMPPDEATRIVLGAAAGIAAGHRAGIIHRDVKPANIFLAADSDDFSYRVCVLDFGIALLAAADDTTRLTRNGIPLSVPYASPEQLRGSGELTPASDVFSLGAVCFELLGRRRPFSGNSADALEERVATLPPLQELNPAVSSALAATVAKALSVRPEDRFPDAQAFRASLEAAAEAHVPASIPVRSLSEPRKPHEAVPPAASLPALGPVSRSTDDVPVRRTPPPEEIATMVPSGTPTGAYSLPAPLQPTSLPESIGGRSPEEELALADQRPVAARPEVSGASHGEPAPLPLKKNARSRAALVGAAVVAAMVAGVLLANRSSDVSTPEEIASAGAEPAADATIPGAASTDSVELTRGVAPPDPPALPGPVGGVTAQSPRTGDRGIVPAAPGAASRQAPTAAGPPPAPLPAVRLPVAGGSEFKENLSHRCQALASTAATECLRADMAGADAELNSVYQQILSGMDPDQRAAVRESQRAWLARYDQVITSYYSTAWGDHSLVEVLPSQIQALRDRTAYLRSLQR